jgi:2-haloacid dehalogenase
MEEVRALVAEVEKFKPFPEVPEALARLATRYQPVVLSNGDPDMLEAAQLHHTIRFDRRISAAEANSFKPDVATYSKAAELAGVPRGRGAVRRQSRLRLHRGQGSGDADRRRRDRRRPFGITPYQPDIRLPSMTDLADVMV